MVQRDRGVVNYHSHVGGATKDHLMVVYVDLLPVWLYKHVARAIAHCEASGVSMIAAIWTCANLNSLDRRKRIEF